MLLACQALREEESMWCSRCPAPFTILNVLIDAKYVFKAMRKPELMKEVFWKLGGEILRFMEENVRSMAWI